MAPDKLKTHTNEGKEQEKKKERGGRKEEKRKNAMVALLVFIMAKAIIGSYYGS